MEIINSEATFDVHITGSKTNETYLGTFRVKCMLSPLEEIAADRMYREMLGVNPHLAQERIRRLTFALAQLDQRVIDYPPFWENDRINGGHITDDNVILDILDKAVEAQEEYINRKKKKLEEAQKRMAEMIKRKDIEKEPEMKDLHDEMKRQEEEIDLGDN